ncbi:MAG: hypothetical protein GY928_00535 [Colwellia sp.]|nr:hypothetical protein [Colwellia sp.]
MKKYNRKPFKRLNKNNTLVLTERGQHRPITPKWKFLFTTQNIFSMKKTGAFECKQTGELREFNLKE